MKIKSIIAGAVAAILVLSSCNKYEDGPSVSLLSKKSRVENNWTIDKAFRNGEDVTNDYDQYELNLRKDGDARLAALYTLGNFSYEYETNGTWTFKDNKESIQFDFENNDADRAYQILKLEEDALWLREIGGEDELHLKTK